MSEVVLKGLPDFDKLEIVKTGTIVVSHPANSLQVTEEVEHNLDYFPIVLAYFYLEEQGIYLSLPFILSTTTNGKTLVMYDTYLTNTSVGMRLSTPNFVGNNYYSGSYSQQFKYYLLRQRTL